MILVVIAVAVLLAMPVFLHAREASLRARCLSHLRSLSDAMAVYVTNNSDRYPLSMPADNRRWYPNREAVIPAESHLDRAFWANALNIDPENLACPILAAPLAYAYNGYLHALPKSAAANPKMLVLLWEGFGKDPRNVSSPRLDCGDVQDPCSVTVESVSTIAEPPPRSTWMHGRGANFLFLDGHAAWRRLGDGAGKPTDPSVDPFHEYDRSGRVNRFWLDKDGKAPLFKP